METKSGSYCFIVLLATYLLLHLAQATGTGPEPIRFYGKDLIIVPIILLGVTRIQGIIQQEIEIRKREIVVLVIYISITFEFLMPLLKPEVKTDFWDILMYIVGAELYYLYLRNTSEQAFMKKNSGLKETSIYENRKFVR